MGDETEIKNLDDQLAEKLEEFYPDEKKEPEEKEEVQEEETTAEESSDVDDEINAQESKDEESEEETQEEEQENIDEEKPDFDKSLSGFGKKFRDLVKSIEDPELQNQIIDAGKIERADLDRKRLEYGESNKLAQLIDNAVKTNGLSYSKSNYGSLIQNYLGFDALFTKDPKLAIKNLAESANIRLDDLTEKKQLVEEDYRTPEEITADERVAKLEEKFNLIERQNVQQSQKSVAAELDEFASAKDAEGNLKYPHFEQVRKTMGLFFTDDFPDMTMHKAYNKAILLDDDLVSKRDAEILRRANEDRKKAVEKAKSLKKQSVKLSRVSTRTNNPDANMESIVSSLGF